MNCLACEEILLAALDQAPDAGTQSSVDAHLAECPDCVARLKDYVLTNQILRRLGPVEAAEPCEPLPERLIARMLAATQLEAVTHGRSRTA